MGLGLAVVVGDVAVAAGVPRAGCVAVVAVVADEVAVAAGVPRAGCVAVVAVVVGDVAVAAGVPRAGCVAVVAVARSEGDESREDEPRRAVGSSEPQATTVTSSISARAQRLRKSRGVGNNLGIQGTP